MSLLERFYCWLAWHLPPRFVVAVLLRAFRELPAPVVEKHPSGFGVLKPHTTRDLMNIWASKAFGRPADG